MLFNTTLVAIDIGSSAIKIVELSMGNVKTLKSFGLELLPEGSIIDGMIQNEGVVVSALKKLVKRLGIRTLGRRVALSIGGSSVIVKKVEFPNKDEFELADLIETEAEQHFQHAIDELYFTWHTLEASNDELERSVLLVGAKKELVEQHIAVVKSLGFRIGVIDCDVFGVYNMFEYNFGFSENLMVLANIGASSSQVSLVASGEYLYTRDIPIGGANYSKNLASSLNLTFAHSETLKISAADEKMKQKKEMSEVINIINSLNDRLVNQIQQTIDFYIQNHVNSQFNSNIDGVFLSGGGAKIFGLDVSLTKKMSVPVHIVNPFRKFALDKNISQAKAMQQGHIFAIASGLSLRELEDVI